MEFTQKFGPDLNTIYLLLIIKNKIFLNSLKKVDKGPILLSLILILFLGISIFKGSSLFVSVFHEVLNKNSDIFLPALNICVCILFMANIILPLLLGGLQKQKNVFSVLIYYPFGLITTVLFEIISGMTELLFLFFVPFYFGAFLIVNGSMFSPKFLLFIPGFILFMVLLSNTIFLCKNIFSMISASRILKRILLFFGVAVLLMIIIFPEVIKLEKVLIKEDVILFSQVLDYTPSGMFVTYLRTIAKPLDVINFSFIILAFLFLNAIIFALNIWLAKDLKEKRFRASGGEFRSKKSSNLSIILNLLKINSYLKKDFIYLFRSVNTMAFLLYWVYIIYSIQYYSVDLVVKLILLLCVTVAFFGVNMFSHEFSGIVNYYSLPITGAHVLRNKKKFIDVLIACAVFVLLIITFFFNSRTPSLNHILFVLGIFSISYFIFMYSCLALSVYFPYRVDYHSLWGRQVSYSTMLLFLPILLVSVWLSFFISSSYAQSNIPIGIHLVIYTITFGLVSLKKTLLKKLGNRFEQRKERIIAACQ